MGAIVICDACGNPGEHATLGGCVLALQSAAAEAEAIGYAHGASAVLRELRGILYSDGPDTSWDSDTLDAVAHVLARHGVAP